MVLYFVCYLFYLLSLLFYLCSFIFALCSLLCTLYSVLFWADTPVPPLQCLYSVICTLYSSLVPRSIHHIVVGNAFYNVFLLFPAHLFNFLGRNAGVYPTAFDTHA